MRYDWKSVMRCNGLGRSMCLAVDVWASMGGAHPAWVSTVTICEGVAIIINGVTPWEELTFPGVVNNCLLAECGSPGSVCNRTNTIDEMRATLGRKWWQTFRGMITLNWWKDQAKHNHIHQDGSYWLLIYAVRMRIGMNSTKSCLIGTKQSLFQRLVTKRRF